MSEHADWEAGRGRPGPRPRAWPALVIAAALTLTCAAVAGIAASEAVAELTRGPSAAELERAAREEVARRWQTWPTGRIFPETLTYSAEQGGEERARRVGIGRDSRCDGAVDAALRPAMRAAGCRGILRATYLDALQGVVVTLGVAAFPDESSALRAKAAFPKGERPSPGLRALAFPGTVTDRFTSAGRQAGTVRQAGPYVVLTTAGQVDGRPARAVGEQRPAVFAFAGEMAEQVAGELATPVVPDCTSTTEWQC
ncbi:hypothetical protein HNP84_003616 [Thermocatellispora tengchongensis]|uniref:Uncharacterized protein n=1 Tax=Thermocatellispora tengchongensis TaxID=1073253 RepID=A0A840P8X6_9ACTN|nr:hypothetical protein [Thermocatellispora tengchongensis]MBB5133890.1 hypothetical protein [Thermocatellispora tengchongensis]